MKNTGLNLESLENADELTIDRISERFTKLNSSKKEMLFRMSEKRYLDRIKEDTHVSDVEEIVLGVENYHRPKFHKFLAFASAFLLVVGMGTCSMILYKNLANTPDIEKATDLNEETAAPFGKISDDKIRIMTGEYSSCIIKINDDMQQNIFESLNNTTWKKVQPKNHDSDYFTIFVYNGGDYYRLNIYSDNVIKYEKNGKSAEYSVSEDVYNTVRTAVSSESIILSTVIDTNYNIWKQLENANISEYIEAVNHFNLEHNSTYGLAKKEQLERQGVYYWEYIEELLSKSPDDLYNELSEAYERDMPQYMTPHIDINDEALEYHWVNDKSDSEIILTDEQINKISDMVNEHLWETINIQDTTEISEDYFVITTSNGVLNVYLSDKIVKWSREEDIGTAETYFAIWQELEDFIHDVITEKRSGGGTANTTPYYGVQESTEQVERSIPQDNQDLIFELK